MREHRLLLTEHAIDALGSRGVWIGQKPLPGPYRLTDGPRMADLCISVIGPDERVDDLPDCHGIAVVASDPVHARYERLSLLKATLSPQELFAIVMPDALLDLSPAVAAWAKGSL